MVEKERADGVCVAENMRRRWVENKPCAGGWVNVRCFSPPTPDDACDGSTGARGGIGSADLPCLASRGGRWGVCHVSECVGCMGRSLSEAEAGGGRELLSQLSGGARV